jgi:hypothetical protein
VDRTALRLASDDLRAKALSRIRPDFSTARHFDWLEVLNKSAREIISRIGDCFTKFLIAEHRFRNGLAFDAESSAISDSAAEEAFAS